MSSDAFTAVGPRRPPGPFAWTCGSGCSRKDPYKSGKYPGCWNGAQALQRRGCNKAAPRVFLLATLRSF